MDPFLFGAAKNPERLCLAWGYAPSPAIFGPQPCMDEAEESAWIAQQAKSIIDAGRDAGDIAILYRQNQ